MKRVAELDGRPRAAGEPGATPAVLLHGFTGSTATWDPVAPFIGVARPVWAVDLPGHGRSTAPRGPSDCTMPAVARAVAEWASAADLLAAGGSHWVGYSMGGRVALHVALFYPAAVASLTLVGASPGIDDPWDRSARLRSDLALADMLETEGLEAFVDHWLAQDWFASQRARGPDYMAGAKARRMANDPRALAAVLRSMGTGAQASVMERLREIAVPVLLVVGEADAKYRSLAATMASSLADGRVAVVAGAGHAVPEEAPEALARVVAGFLDEVRVESPSPREAP